MYTAPVLDSPITTANAHSVPTLIQLQARQQPDHPAIVVDRDTLSYAALNQRANQIAHCLHGLNVQPDALVGVCLPRSLDAIVAMLGILKAGAAYLPLDPDYPQERLAYMIEDAKLSVLISDEAYLQLLPPFTGTVLNLEGDSAQLAAQPTEDFLALPLPQHLAYVIYTSGSTGVPKGVAVEHHSLTNLVEWHQQAYDVTSHDRATQFAGLSFDASVWEIWCHLCAGATLYLVPNDVRQKPAVVLPWFAEHQITISFLPTPVVELLWGFPIPTNLKLRYLLTGGDALRRLPSAPLPFTLVNHYGPTENTVVATAAIVNPAEEVIPAIGTPLPTVSVHLLDEAHQPVAIGGVGELYIGGDSLARGYLNQPAMSQARFLPDPFSPNPGARLYRTGDLARYRADGNLEFIGRCDHQVKIRGFRVELGEIEAAILKHPDIQQCAVLAKPDPTGNQTLVAFVVAVMGIDVATSDLPTFLQTTLPDYMIPSAIVALPAFPMTPNGKVDRQALQVLPLTSPAHSTTDPTVEPDASTIEAQIALIWQELLGLEHINRDDDFFELGGHSLGAGLLIARLYEQFQIDLSIEQFFEISSLAELAQLVEQLQSQRV